MATERGAFERSEPVECVTRVQLFDRSGRRLGEISLTGAEQLLRRGWKQRNPGKVIRELECVSNGRVQ